MGGEAGVEQAGGASGSHVNSKHEPMFWSSSLKEANGEVATEGLRGGIQQPDAMSTGAAEAGGCGCAGVMCVQGMVTGWAWGAWAGNAVVRHADAAGDYKQGVFMQTGGCSMYLMPMLFCCSVRWSYFTGSL